MRRTKEDTEISRQQILDAAENIFCRKGFTGTKLNDIADAIGMTKGAIFWHFESKAGLFRAIHIRAVARLREILTTTMALPDPIMERFKKTVFAVRHDSAFDVLLSIGLGDITDVPSNLQEEVNESIDQLLGMVRSNIEEALSNGLICTNASAGEILSPLLLVMSGFRNLNIIKQISGQLASIIDGDTAIEAIFKGLNSYQTKK